MTGSAYILADGGIGGAFFWLLLVLGLAVVGYVAVTWVRRWAAEPDQGPAGGFTLGDLREMHKNGQMTDAEYEKAKGKIVQAAQAAAARQAAAAQQPRSPGVGPRSGGGKGL